MSVQKRLLIVDDDNVHRTIYSVIASKLGFAAELASSFAEARAALRAGPVHCVLLDLMLGAHSGADVLKYIAGLPEKPRVILVSGAAQSVVDRAIRYGSDLGIEVSEPIHKPVDIARLRFLLRRVGKAIDLAFKSPGAELGPGQDFII